MITDISDAFFGPVHKCIVPGCNNEWLGSSLESPEPDECPDCRH